MYKYSNIIIFVCILVSNVVPIYAYDSTQEDAILMNSDPSGYACKYGPVEKSSMSFIYTLSEQTNTPNSLFVSYGQCMSIDLKYYRFECTDQQLIIREYGSSDCDPANGDSIISITSASSSVNINKLLNQYSRYTQYIYLTCNYQNINRFELDYKLTTGYTLYNVGTCSDYISLNAVLGYLFIPSDDTTLIPMIWGSVISQVNSTTMRIAPTHTDTAIDYAMSGTCSHLSDPSGTDNTLMPVTGNRLSSSITVSDVIGSSIQASNPPIQTPSRQPNTDRNTLMSFWIVEGVFSISTLIACIVAYNSKLQTVSRA